MEMGLLMTMVGVMMVSMWSTALATAGAVWWHNLKLIAAGRWRDPGESSF